MDAVVLGDFLADLAKDPFRVKMSPQPFQASCIIREITLKVTNRITLHPGTHELVPYIPTMLTVTYKYNPWYTYGQGIVTIFMRVHRTLRVTPAMQAGIADHVCAWEELLAHGAYSSSPQT